MLPTAQQENLSKQDQSLNKELPENEIVMEFSPDIFKAPLLDDELNSDKDISIDESISNGQGLE